MRGGGRVKVVWKPLPGSQALALTAPVSHILYEGTRGPGKTDAQLMRFRRYVGQGYGSFWRGVIFDRRYKNLDDLIAKGKRWFSQFGDGAKFLSSMSDLKWVWPSGEELLFRHLEKDKDYENYHGHEYPFIGWNELTKYATSACYDAMMSCNRSSFIPLEHTPKKPDGTFATPDGKPLPEIPLTVFSTSNPFGVGHNWVKRRFIDPAPAGNVVRKKTRVFNPRTQQEEDFIKTQVRLFGSYRENRYLSPEYVADLENITDPNRRAAWLNGSWDITAGGAFDDIWREDVHVLPRFQIPAYWRVVRSLDWGSSHPFSVGFWAISNGEEVEIAPGKKRAFARGSRIRIAEIYGAEIFGGEKYGHNRGRKLSARKVAREVKEAEETLRLMGWITGNVEPGPADNQIFNVNEDESGSIASLMEKEGVTWTRSDKSAGTRKNGFELLRNALEAARTGEGPGLWVMRNCEAFTNTVPSLPRDEDEPDDVDTTAEDHVYDDTRYMILDAKPVFAGSVKIKFAN